MGLQHVFDIAVRAKEFGLHFRPGVAAWEANSGAILVETPGRGERTHCLGFAATGGVVRNLEVAAARKAAALVVNTNAIVFSRELYVWAAKTGDITPILALLDFFEVLIVTNHDIWFKVERYFSRGHSWGLGF